MVRTTIEAWVYVVGQLRLIEDEERRDKVKELLKVYKEPFCSMPAATKHHHNYEGGLIIHIAEVLWWALHINEEIGDKFSKESIYISAIFHDFSKVELFEKRDTRTFKYKVGAWNMEHTILCVSIAGEHGITFSYNELMGIFQAHGGWSKINNPSNQLASLIHAADMISSQLIGKLTMNG